MDISYHKLTNTLFFLLSWAEAWCKCNVMPFIRDCLHGSLAHCSVYDKISQALPSPIFSFLQSAVTHNSRVDKTCEVLTWTAPPNGTGPVFFQWAVVRRYSPGNINMFYAPLTSMMINESEDCREVQILLAPHPGSFLF